MTATEPIPNSALVAMGAACPPAALWTMARGVMARLKNHPGAEAFTVDGVDDEAAQAIFRQIMVVLVLTVIATIVGTILSVMVIQREHSLEFWQVLLLTLGMLFTGVGFLLGVVYAIYLTVRGKKP